MTVTIKQLQNTPGATVPVTYYAPLATEYNPTVHMTPAGKAAFTLPIEPPMTIITNWTMIAVAVNSEISIQVMKSGIFEWEQEYMEDEEVAQLVAAVRKDS